MDALGGEERIEAITTLHLSATVKTEHGDADTAEVDIAVKPEGILSRREIVGQRGTQTIVSGDAVGPSVASAHSRSISTAVVRSIKFQFQPYVPPAVQLYRAISDAEYSIFSMTKAEGSSNQCQIEIAWDKTPGLSRLSWQRWTFDCANFLPLSVEYEISQPSRRAPTLPVRLEYADLAPTGGGWLTPMRLTTFYGLHSTTATITSLSINSSKLVQFDGDEAQ